MSEEFYPAVPQLQCFPEYEGAPELRAGRGERDWMDATPERFAYRCTPLSIANASGWELVSPVGFDVVWNGGNSTSDLRIVGDDPRTSQIASSIFGHGIITFHPGYLFRTSAGWALSVRGAPNVVKDGVAPLEGLVETDWLPFTFTMNWKMTRAGSARFERGECFCFLALVPHAILDQVRPRIRRFEDEPHIKGAYDYWRQNRAEFQRRVALGDREAILQGWQRDYVHGRDPSGTIEPVFHLSKRRLKEPG